MSSQHRRGAAMARQLAQAASHQIHKPVQVIDNEEDDDLVMYDVDPRLSPAVSQDLDSPRRLRPGKVPALVSYPLVSSSPQRREISIETIPDSKADGSDLELELSEEEEDEEVQGEEESMTLDEEDLKNPFAGMRDRWGRALSFEAAEAARSYWECQRACDDFEPGEDEDWENQKATNILLRMAEWRREYTRLILSLEKLPPGQRTYEPPLPPLQLEGPLPGERSTSSAILNKASPSQTHSLPIQVTPDPELFSADKDRNSQSPVAKRTPAVPLDPEQSALVDLIVGGANVFYTGSAGCGKSTVLKAFVKRLRDTGKDVHILAPTGRAALEVNGSTTWTYAGWTPELIKYPLSALTTTMLQKKTRQRLRKTDTIVIDEISMVDSDHFRRLNEVMKAARENSRAFGGAQVIVTGDFFQLPPVKPFAHCIDCGKQTRRINGDKITYECTNKKCGRIRCDDDKWAFRSTAWAECDFVHVELRKIHRQSDVAFIEVLQKCRLGQALGGADVELLMNHQPCYTGGAVKLFSTIKEVKAENDTNFNRLKTETYEYNCRDAVYYPDPNYPPERLSDGTVKVLEKDHRYDRIVGLKQGMRVVLLVNLDIKQGLINGSQGIICGFKPYDRSTLPPVSDSDDHSAIKSSEVIQFMEAKGKDSLPHNEKKFWPVVRFTNKDQPVVIHADCRINEYGDRRADGTKTLLCRTQIPLMAAWALSIHKSQGMTLDRVIVDVSRAFEEGQVYVALSRARALEGLKVEGDLRAGLAISKGGNDQVQEFYRRMFRPLPPPMTTTMTASLSAG